MPKEGGCVNEILGSPGPAINPLDIDVHLPVFTLIDQYFRKARKRWSHRSCAPRPSSNRPGPIGLGVVSAALDQFGGGQAGGRVVQLVLDDAEEFGGFAQEGAINCRGCGLAFRRNSPARAEPATGVFFSRSSSMVNPLPKYSFSRWVAQIRKRVAMRLWTR